jgi:Glycosyl hydrolase family 1
LLARSLPPLEASISSLSQTITRLTVTAAPKATSAANSKGLDFYHRLLDEFITNGIAPFPTLQIATYPNRCKIAAGGETVTPPNSRGFVRLT